MTNYDTLPKTKIDTDVAINEEEIKIKELEAKEELLLQHLLDINASPDQINDIQKSRGLGSTKIIEETKANIKATFDKKEKETQEENINKRLKGINLNEDELKAIPEWATLSYGGKILALEQASQSILSQVKEIAEKRFTEKNKISWKLNNFNPKSFSLKVFRKIGKSFYISKEEKDALKEVREGKMKPDMETFKNIVKNITDINLNITEKDGKAVIEFTSIDKNLTDEEQKITKEYNEAANEYARMPDEWKNEKAANSIDEAIFNKKNYENFNNSRNKYEQLRKTLIDIKAKQYENKNTTKDEATVKAMNETNVVDFKIAMLQLNYTNPDSLAELDRIQNEASWKRLVNNENIWRGLYITGGILSRKGLTYGIGLFAAPFVAGAIGGIRSRIKASDKIDKAFSEGRKEESFLERREAGKNGLYGDKNANLGALGTAGKLLSGFEVNTKEVAAFIDADSQTQRLNNLISKLESTQDNIEKMRIISELSKRVDYIKDKHRDGLINYGKENPIGTGYAMLKCLSEASVQVQMNAFDLNKIPDEKITIDYLDNQGKVLGTKQIEMRDWIKEQMEQRNRILDQIVSNNKIKFGKKQADYKLKETKRGIAVGAGFSLLGLEIRDWYYGQNNLEASINVVAPVNPKLKIDLEYIKSLERPKPIFDVSKINEHINNTVKTPIVPQIKHIVTPGEVIEQPNVKPTDELLNNQKVPGEVIEQPNVPINTTGSASNEIRTGGVTETGRAPNPINIENVKEDPRYLETASDVRKAIGRHNVIIEKPLGKTIDGIEYKNLNKAIDYSFEKRNIKFDSYNEYNKEHELQELFGQAKQVTRYDPTLDKNTEFIDVYEFRKMKEWNIINKIPAKYFFDFSDVKEISGDKIINIPQTDIDALIKRGIIIKNQIVDSNGTSTFNYTFSHKDKLLQLAKIYKKILSEKDIALGNEMPLITNNGEENIESYIRRITRRVYETNNGTLFATKKDIDFTSYRDHSDGMVIQSERIPVSNNMRTGTILPTNNNYHSTGNYYGPNMRLASRAANILIGRINISTRIFH